MNKAKQALIKARNHVAENKGAYILGAVAIAAIALQQYNRTQFNEFLTEKGIDLDEYYCPEYYEEKQANKQALIEAVHSEYPR